MSKAYVFLAEGFEETEAVGTIDVLRRGGVSTTVVSISNELQVVGAHGIPVVADTLISNMSFDDVDALVLPGGMPGTMNLSNSQLLCKALIDHYNKGKIVAAICAAPIILGQLTIAEGKRVTCYPGCESQLDYSICTSSAAEKDGNIITGRAPGTVYDFALKLLETLEGRQAASSVANGLTTAKELGY